METPNWWINVIQQLGAPTAMLLGLLSIIVYALRALFRWSAPRVDKIIDAHTKFLSESTTTSQDIAAAVAKTKELHGITHAKLDELHKGIQLVECKAPALYKKDTK
jgi:hypothetical protein